MASKLSLRQDNLHTLSLVNLRLQPSTPSIHLCSIFLFPPPPQFLNQAPPGAQQLIRPDFANVPHFGHVIAVAIVNVTAGVVVGECISSRSGNGRRVTCWRVASVISSVGVHVHTVRDIDPDEPVNMSFFIAFERTHAGPQSSCLNDTASQNSRFMLITLDTSHLEMSLLNVVAPSNILTTEVTLDTSHFEISTLNAVAPLNVWFIELTLDTSHLDMSLLKAGAR